MEGGPWKQTHSGTMSEMSEQQRIVKRYSGDPRDASKAAKLRFAPSTPGLQSHERRRKRGSPKRIRQAKLSPCQRESQGVIRGHDAILRAELWLLGARRRTAVCSVLLSYCFAEDRCEASITMPVSPT